MALGTFAAGGLHAGGVQARHHAGVGDELLEHALVVGVDIGIVGIDLPRI
jgi:hypothetical protein